MTAELERLKTTCLAQEAEIARLQAGFDELKSRASGYENLCHGDDYASGFETAMYVINFEISRITGESK